MPGLGVLIQAMQKTYTRYHFGARVSHFFQTSVSFLQVLPPAPGYKIMWTTSAPRLIMVDDVDPSIQYNGPWYLSEGSLETEGTWGPPYQSTLHGVNSSASLSYAFSGEQPLFFPQSSSILINQDLRIPGHCNWLQ